MSGTRCLPGTPPLLALSDTRADSWLWCERLAVPSPPGANPSIVSLDNPTLLTRPPHRSTSLQSGPHTGKCAVDILKGRVIEPLDRYLPSVSPVYFVLLNFA